MAMGLVSAVLCRPIGKFWASIWLAIFVLFNPLYLKGASGSSSTNLPLICVQVDLVFSHEGFGVVLSSTPFGPGPLLKHGYPSALVLRSIRVFLTSLFVTFCHCSWATDFGLRPWWNMSLFMTARVCSYSPLWWWGFVHGTVTLLNKQLFRFWMWLCAMTLI